MTGKEFYVFGLFYALSAWVAAIILINQDDKLVLKKSVFWPLTFIKFMLISIYQILFKK